MINQRIKKKFKKKKDSMETPGCGLDPLEGQKLRAETLATWWEECFPEDSQLSSFPMSLCILRLSDMYTRFVRIELSTDLVFYETSQCCWSNLLKAP